MQMLGKVFVYALQLELWKNVGFVTAEKTFFMNWMENWEI